MTGFLLTAKQKLMLCINKRLYRTCGRRRNNRSYRTDRTHRAYRTFRRTHWTDWA